MSVVGVSLPGMWARLLSNDAIIAMVGHEAFARGMVYARNGNVADVRVDTERADRDRSGDGQ